MKLVSVVVTTLNSERTIASCLKSVCAQSYPAVELIVVDNHSVDRTADIARNFTSRVMVAGPERSEQRNLGIAQASGYFVLIIDSDMVLEPEVVSRCVDLWSFGACIIAIPEVSFGVGYWAQCKALERSCYTEDLLIAAARFYERGVLTQIGGYDTALHAGEDWDLSIRAEALRPLRIADTKIMHDEGDLQLALILRKKFYYGTSMSAFLRKHGDEARRRLSPFRSSLFRGSGRLARTPLIGAGVVLMKSLEMLFGFLGMAAGGKRSPKDVYMSEPR